MYYKPIDRKSWKRLAAKDNDTNIEMLNTRLHHQVTCDDKLTSYHRGQQKVKLTSYHRGQQKVKSGRITSQHGIF